jgi:hypothetical protein
MNEIPGWVWPLAAVVAGLALGIVLGARRQRGEPVADDETVDVTPSRLASDGAAPGRGVPADSTPQQRLLERLRAANLQLSAQMKSLAEANSRQSQEREQERQSERLRHERALEELRQAHSGELSHLMNTLVEQVDGLNKAHAEQVKLLDAELEKARQDSRRSGFSSGPGTLQPTSRPGPGAAAPGSPGTRGGPTDYSLTLPMESLPDR